MTELATQEKPISLAEKDPPASEHLLLIALWSWLNHHPKPTFSEFCNAWQRAKEVATS